MTAAAHSTKVGRFQRDMTLQGPLIKAQDHASTGGPSNPDPILPPAMPAAYPPLVPLWLLLHPAQSADLAVDPIQIPGGAFSQGTDTEPDAPPRTVTLTPFSIARTEVTVADYERFVADGGYQQTAIWSTDALAWLAAHPEGAGAESRAAGRPGDHPVVAVTWFEADAWCRWAGGRLPTEAEWERAACGTDGRRFPWGDDDAVAAQWYAGGKFGDVTSVATAPAAEQALELRSADGIVHMSGNVWEWTADRYHRLDWGGSTSRDPLSTADTPWHVLRGGSFMNLPSYSTCRHREPARPDRVAYTSGFRCVWEQP